MKLIISALTASAILIGTVGTQDTSAARRDGWWYFDGAATKTRSFNDGSGRRTPVVLYLQKRTGNKVCRAQVTVKSGGYVWQSKTLYKYTRNQTRGFAGTIDWPNSARRTTITVKTNGN